MALKDRAVLVIEVDGTTGEFHLMQPEFTSELTREYLMEDRGQAIREALDVLDADADGGQGQESWSVDAGQGQDTLTLSWQGGYEQDSYNGVGVQWGDGSAGTDRWDATGAEPMTQAQVLKWWLRSTRADSFRQRADLHFGEWTDGSIAGSAGIFGEPIPVTIQSVRLERDDRSPSDYEGSLEVKRTRSQSELEAGDENNPSSVLLNR